MFKKNKELRLMTLIALGLSVVGVVFACVAMNVALNIKKTESVWNVSFTDLVEETQGTGSSKSVPIITSTSISNFHVNLMRTDDTITYKFKIKNSGAVDAKIKVVSDIIPTCIVNSMNSTTDVCSEVSYKLTYSDGTLVKVGDVVSSGTSKEVKLTIEYFGDSITSLELTDLDFMLLFEQA